MIKELVQESYVGWICSPDLFSALMIAKICLTALLTLVFEKHHVAFFLPFL